MSFGVKVPIQRDSVNGFLSLDSFSETIKQNFKMLILTNPGERVMIPDYGVGIKTYLFENFNMNAESQLKNKIIEQVSIYMPLLTINDLVVGQSNEQPNSLSVLIYYSIPDLGIQDLLEFTI